MRPQVGLRDEDFRVKAIVQDRDCQVLAELGVDVDRVGRLGGRGGAAGTGLGLCRYDFCGLLVYSLNQGAGRLDRVEGISLEMGRVTEFAASHLPTRRSPALPHAALQPCDTVDS